jgi:hypothetical protein
MHLRRDGHFYFPPDTSMTLALANPQPGTCRLTRFVHLYLFQRTHA